ncbi:MAG: hypothetical protein R8M46_08570 [Ghiorsea sp.]
MNHKFGFSFVFSIFFSLLLSVQAHAFTSGDIFEAILSSHQDDESITDVKKVTGTNNAWKMKFLSRTADTEEKDSEAYGIPTAIRYAGSRLHITQQLAKVDYRVVGDVFEDSDVKNKLEELSNYDGMMSDLSGFEAKVTHDGRRMNLAGSISVAGKKLDQVKDLLVDLRSETDELYYELEVANRDALEDYFEKVLDKNYGAILDTQTFIEVLGHGFTKLNQQRRKESMMGHWAWNVEEIQTETINQGRYFDEVFLLNTGTDLSQYKQEKMFEELKKRVKARLPKGARTLVVKPHAFKKGVTAIVLSYPLKKSPDGEAIRGYHDKFIAYVTNTYPDMLKIMNKHTASAVSQKIKSLTAREFMELMDDGLENLPIYDADGANGQWKFKYKNVAYIVTNYAKHMSLSFISTLPKGRNMNDILRNVKGDIEQNFETFADEHSVTTYKNNKRTLLVKMRFNYGVLSSSEITGKKLKEQYHQFTNDVAPELKSRL